MLPKQFDLPPTTTKCPVPYTIIFFAEDIGDPKVIPKSILLSDIVKDAPPLLYDLISKVLVYVYK